MLVNFKISYINNMRMRTNENIYGQLLIYTNFYINFIIMNAEQFKPNLKKKEKEKRGKS